MSVEALPQSSRSCTYRKNSLKAKNTCFLHQNRSLDLVRAWGWSTPLKSSQILLKFLNIYSVFVNMYVGGRENLSSDTEGTPSSLRDRWQNDDGTKL